MSKTLVPVLFLIALVSLAAPPAAKAATLGLDTFLAGEARRDPSAANDSFSALPAALKRSLAANLPPADHAALVSQLLSFHISVPVYVKLVGDFSSAAPGLLRSFAAAAAAAALTSDRFHVIGATTHNLAVGHTLHLDTALSLLGSQISDAIRSHLEASPSPLYLSALHSVPYASVDRIIQKDFRKESSNSAPGFYVYLLNLGSRTKPYAYSLDSKDASLAFTKCLGTLWTGKDRYVWIDLAAGPVEYGPGISGEGVIPEGSSILSPHSMGDRDSKSLHQILSDSVEEVHQAAAIPEEDCGKVLPVYVFDLEYDKLLLLDRYHQAIAFRNMVIAVRTRSSQTVTDYNCNGRHVITQTRNLDRPIIGSVLQSMWGVLPIHLSWSPQHKRTLVDYTWNVGQTPFGPFSDSLSLSFVQRDAARRNVLLTTLNYTITSAIDILQSMAAHGGDKKILKENKHVAFVQRWNLLNYKLEKVVSAVSHFDLEKAMYFLRSSDHDLYAIHTLVYEASQKLEASITCFIDPPFPWASVSLFGVLLFGFCYFHGNRDKIFRGKRKQF
ncbi:hypothetical protein OPV22_006573 [Ensete ventricosum]|uniref:DUF7906 domain-containing protein n=1 Tax=Ensete ventricosum TaxID=4639 RepID=A0AAV8QC03_ENSVE|nr:hypothetical protein OPV22_006573 [Ensete ventricosum]